MKTYEELVRDNDILRETANDLAMDLATAVKALREIRDDERSPAARVKAEAALILLDEQ